jgi:SET domain-containing protein
MLLKSSLQAKPEETDLSTLTIGNRIIWKPSGLNKGRGVYALMDIAEGEVLEQSPVTVIAKAETDFLEEERTGYESMIDQYLLRWQPSVKGQEYCLGHGFLMLYNHHPKPNGYLKYDFDFKTISMCAGRDIKAGEEITFDYDCELWFDVQV